MNYISFLLPDAADLAQALIEAYSRGEKCPPDTAEALREALMPGPKCPRDCPYRLKESVAHRKQAVEVSVKLPV